MRLLLITLLALLLCVSGALAQGDAGDTGGTPAPPPSQQPVTPPANPNAPIIVGNDKEAPTGPPVEGQPKCECCGHYLKQSPTRIEAVVIRSAGGEKELINYESVPCMLRDTAKEGSKLIKFRVLDYTTAGSENEVMLDGGEAFYVYGARPIPGSSAPYIAAFATEEKAREAVDWLEGDSALAYAPLLKRWQADLVAAAATGDGDLPIDAIIPPGEDYFVCPCAGGDCDHIRSDVEGVCPECGLTLVRRSEKLRLLRERAAAAKGTEHDAGSTGK